MGLIPAAADDSGAANDPPAVAAVEFDAVSLLRQDRPVLDELTFMLPAGRLLAIIGGNGAGKSALLNAIVDCPPLDHGTIRLFGREPADPVARRRIGWLPDRAQIERWLQGRIGQGGWQVGGPRVTSQQVGCRPDGSAQAPSLMSGRTRGRSDQAPLPCGVDLLVWFGSHFGMQWTRDEARDLADRHRLTGAWMDEDVQRLSPGMIRLLGLAAALASDRELLLLDEPFAGLDPLTRGRWAEQLGRLREQRRSVLIATRSLADIAPQADRILLLVDGCLSVVGRPQGLMGMPGRRAGKGVPVGTPGVGAGAELADRAVSGPAAVVHLQQSRQVVPTAGLESPTTWGRILPFSSR